MNADRALEGRRAAGLSDETHLAARNGFKLAVSLGATWGVALLVRIYLPRYLGPDRFGLYSFLDSVAMSATALTALGIDGYTQKEIPVRPGHAADYFGGVIVLRLLLGLVVLGGLFFGLVATGRSAATAAVAVVFGLAYVVRVASQSQSALLVAHGTVNRLAVTNVATKIAWGGLVGLAFAAGGGLLSLAVAFLLAELLRGILLQPETRARLGLRLHVNVPRTWAVVVASTPYFANQVTMTLNRLDVPVLTFMTHDDREVGWYGAAMSVSLLVYLLSPVLDAVLLPLMSRLRARSDADMWRVVHRSAQALVAMSAPLALIVILGADLWVRLAFGAEYAPAAASLRVFALEAVLAYLTLLMSSALIALGKGWTVTLSSVVALVLRPVLIAALVLPCARWIGLGGAGAGAAVGLVLSEVAVLVVMVRGAGRAALAAATLRLTLLCALVCAATVALHLALAPLGHSRLALDFVAYCGMAILVGALPIRQILAFVREVLVSRRVAPVPG